MKIQRLLALGFVTLLPLAAQANQEQLANSIKETRVEATRASDQLKATLDALTVLTKQKEGDLRPAYNTFAAEVPKTEGAAAWTQTRVKWMEGDGLNYFTSWQKSVDSVANESLRKQAQKRLNAARKSYNKVGVSLKDASEKFKPFLSDLADIQTVLSKDVTAGGVKAVKSTVSDANWRFKAVNRVFHDALEEMHKMEKALSPEAK